ncbi:hypothetical protein scyTo_0026289, partial [Scyliorhinus torazame]|nr:hypothetical protein [Scyliorhinus torazame]
MQNLEQARPREEVAVKVVATAREAEMPSKAKLERQEAKAGVIDDRLIEVERK